jgi:siderophore ferric iron reductase
MTDGMRAFAKDAIGLGYATAGTWRPMPAPNPDLARTLQLAQRVIPGLHGEQGGVSPADALHLGDTHALQALCDHWTQACPEAGVHYLALRCWGLAIWQPIYLCVIAVHLDGAAPKLAGLAQPVKNGFPSGLHLPVHTPVDGTFAERMDAAAAELRAFCGVIRRALKPMVALHDRAADRLQAECVLGALLAVRPHTSLSDADLIAAGSAWLATLGIAGGCGFFAYHARDGTPALALDRTVCCHHFRRRDGEKCSTCPKLSLDARIARLLAEAS